MNKGLFLDRDGVINYDYGYVHSKGRFEFIPGIFNLVGHANKLNYKVVIVTNQAGIGRGYYSEEVFTGLTNWMLQQFNKNNCRIDAVYFCPFHPVHGIGKFKVPSYDRKPNPGMILKARDRFNLSMNDSILIGDNQSDLIAGKRAGISKLYLHGKKIFSGITYTQLDSLYDFWRLHQTKEKPY